VEWRRKWKNQQNAEDSIRRNNKSDSVEINESNPQQLKQPESKVGMFCGMHMKTSRPKRRMGID
jgi:hypothetical protein